MKNKLFLTALTLVTTFSLCCCGSNPSGSGIYFGKDITAHYRPSTKSDSYETIIYALIEFEKEPEEGLMSSGDAIYYGGNFRVLRKFSGDDIPLNNTRIIFSIKSLNMYKNDYVDCKNLFRQYFSSYKTYLVYLYWDSIVLDGNGNRKYGHYIDETGNVMEVDFLGFEITKGYFYNAIPVANSKIQLSAVQSFVDDCYKVNDYQPLGRANRLELLFEDGDDVYEDFPQKLNYYEEHYDELVESQFSLYK